MNHGRSYIDSPDCIKQKKTINATNEKDDKLC